LVARKENPEVTAYLEAENAYTDVILKPTQDLQEKLYQEMLGRIQQTDLSVPYVCATILISQKPRKENSIRFISGQFGENGPEELLLDLNALAKAIAFLD